MRVKNTFIDVSLRRSEGRRLLTFPMNWKFLAPGPDDDCSADTESHSEDCEQPAVTCAGGFSRRDCARERAFSNESTQIGSPRDRADSLNSVDSSNSDDADGRQVQAATPQAWWTGRVWLLARDRQGCRNLQAVLAASTDAEEKMLLLHELRGHIHEASRDPQANYVLQKCICLCKSSRFQFVIDEITCKGARSVTMVARHKYGCRIIQRLLEHCSQEQTNVLAQALLTETDAMDTCCHMFGNYAMQHLYEYGTVEHRQKLVVLLIQNLACAVDTHLCTVIGKVLAMGDDDDKYALAQAVYNTPGMVASMVNTKPGQFALRAARNALQTSFDGRQQLCMRQT